MGENLVACSGGCPRPVLCLGAERGAWAGRGVPSLPSASNGSGNHSTKLQLAVLSLNVNLIVISSMTFLFKL